jgi:hypothetical protein
MKGARGGKNFPHPTSPSQTGRPDEFVNKSPKMSPKTLLLKLIRNFCLEKVAEIFALHTSEILVFTILGKESPNRRIVAQPSHTAPALNDKLIGMN